MFYWFPSISAIQASVLSRETAGNWIKFTIHVMQVYKQGPAKVHRGTQFLWVSVKDLACKCPKIRIKQTYLILGKHHLKKLLHRFTNPSISISPFPITI